MTLIANSSLLRLPCLLYLLWCSLPNAALAIGPAQQNCIAIAATSDIHGHIEPSDLTNGEHKVRHGGTLAYAGYIEILRQRYGHRLLVLDAGDLYQGTLPSNLSYGKATQAALEYIGVQASTIGNHEFDYGSLTNRIDPLGVIKQRIAESPFPFLTCNIYEKKTGKPIAWPNVAPSMHLHIDDLDIGIVGVSSEDTVHSTHPANIASLQFLAAEPTVRRAAEALRREGANLVILLAHIGAQCQCNNDTDPYDLSSCFGHLEDEGELIPLLQALPKGLIDIAFGGHTHHHISHFVQDTLALQTGQKLGAFSWLELCTDGNKQIQRQTMQIHARVPLCLETWADGTCTEPNGPLPSQQAHFLDQPVVIPPRLQALLNPYLEQTVAIASRPLHHYIPNDLPNRHLAILAAESFRKHSCSNMGLYNFRAVRKQLQKGPLAFGSIYQSFPFQDTVVKVHLTGKEVQQLAHLLGYDDRENPQAPAFAGLTLGPQLPDGSVQLLHEGEPLDMNKWYSIATTTYLVSGGNGSGQVFDNVPPHRIQYLTAQTQESIICFIEHTFPII